jgi:hypothetical protein
MRLNSLFSDTEKKTSTEDIKRNENEDEHETRRAGARCIAVKYGLP